MKLHVITFSPTGGTAKAADILSDGFAMQTVKIDLTDASAFADITSDDLCIIAVPSYGGRVPFTAAERISKLRGNGARAVLVAVYGNREFEDTLIELKDIAEAAGFVPIAAVSAIAEHSILRKFAAGRPDASDCEELASFARKISDSLLQPRTSPLTVPGNKPYKEFKGSAIKPAASDSCIQCGLCAERCPVHAIPSDHPEQTDSSVCISCMRCVSLCPAQARGIAPEAAANVDGFLSKVASVRKDNQLFL